ncbi:uncharacterized protein LOC140704068 isoform X7 [Pogona vitticeps]
MPSETHTVFFLFQGKENNVVVLHPCLQLWDNQGFTSLLLSFRTSCLTDWFPSEIMGMSSSQDHEEEKGGKNPAQCLAYHFYHLVSEDNLEKQQLSSG